MVGYDELSVDLIGSFTKLHESGHIATYPVLHGVTTSGLAVTLVNSQIAREGMVFGAAGIRHSSLQPAWALMGEHFTDPIRQTWRRCSIKLERMTAWASPLGLAQSIEKTADGHLKSLNLHYDVPGNVDLAIPGATLSIVPSQNIVGDFLHDATITVDVSAVFTMDEPATLEETDQRFIKPLLNLVVLATQRPTSLVTMDLAAEAETRTETKQSWVEFVARRLAPALEEHKRLSPINALFLLPELLAAAADGVAQWYAAAVIVERAFDLVSVIRSTTSLYLDHRFLNAAIAAESYHQKRLARLAPLDKPSLKQRIQELVDWGADPLRGLLPDPNGLASRASRLRNALSHGSTGTRNLGIFNTTDELLLVLEFHFLCEAGFSPTEAASRLRNASRSYSGLWLRLQLAAE